MAQRQSNGPPVSQSRDESAPPPPVSRGNSPQRRRGNLHPSSRDVSPSPRGVPLSRSNGVSLPWAQGTASPATLGILKSQSAGHLVPRASSLSSLQRARSASPRPPGISQPQSAGNLVPPSADVSRGESMGVSLSGSTNNSQPQSTTISPETEARFKALADKCPPTSDDEIQQNLSKPPVIDKAIYYRWSINYRAQRALRTLRAPPKSNYEAVALLKSTDYNNPCSVSRLRWEINSSAGIARLPLGNYTAENMKIFCYLHFQTTLLPQDLRHSGQHTESKITYLKCDPDSDFLPKSVHQVGKLCLSSNNNAVSAQPSCFVIGVTPAREVFAVWNPNGPDPEYAHDEASSQASNSRAVSGKLRGFKDPCTAIKLADNINTLCGPQQEHKVLDISKWRFITLEPQSALQFTD